MKKSQTAIEYLLIFAIVIVLAAVVVMVTLLN